ncbi:MAG: YcaO-like family protein, partial [Burkholderiales bacterium]
FFLGGAFSTNQEQVMLVAKAEVLERLLATYDLNSKRIDKSPLYESWLWPEKCFDRMVHASHVILGDMPAFKAFHPDASGLGYHSNREQAVKHAIYEILERHILCLIWYGNLPLFHVDTTWLSNEFTCDFYTPAFADFIPFILTVIKSKKETVFMCGSALSDHFNKAKEKSFYEAAMLLEDFLAKRSGICHASLSRKKILALADPHFFKLRSQFIEQKRCATIAWQRIDMLKMEEDKIGELLGISELKISYVFLHENPQQYVVRAFFPQLKTLASERLKQPLKGKHNIPFDPVC